MGTTGSKSGKKTPLAVPYSDGDGKRGVAGDKLTSEILDERQAFREAYRTWREGATGDERASGPSPNEVVYSKYKTGEDTAIRSALTLII